MTREAGDITQLLQAWARKDPEALGSLFPLVFEELRRLAAFHLQRAGSASTLQPTAVVHEAYLKLVRRDIEGFDSRHHFFAFASKVLRGVLVDHARAKGARKRAGSGEMQSLDEARQVAAPLPGIDLEQVLAVNGALSLLEELHPRQARVVELRYFGGLSMQEISLTLELSQRTVERDWQAAQRWLARELAPLS